MEEKKDQLQTDADHDAAIIRSGDAIFSEDDLHGIINFILEEYQYKGSQLDKLLKMRDFLALPNNRFIDPEMEKQKQVLSDFLDNLKDFLDKNFHKGPQIADGDILYLISLNNTGFETESFLMEFQMLAMDIEKAYKSYHAKV